MIAPSSAGPRPSASSTARPLGASARPAPIALGAAIRSTTVTRAPARASSRAVAAPPVAAPATRTFREERCIETRLSEG